MGLALAGLDHVGADEQFPVGILPLVAKTRLEGVRQPEGGIRVAADLLALGRPHSHRVEHYLPVDVVQHGLLLHPAARQPGHSLDQGGQQRTVEPDALLPEGVQVEETVQLAEPGEGGRRVLRDDLPLPPHQMAVCLPPLDTSRTVRPLVPPQFNGHVELLRRGVRNVYDLLPAEVQVTDVVSPRRVRHLVIRPLNGVVGHLPTYISAFCRVDSTVFWGVIPHGGQEVEPPVERGNNVVVVGAAVSWKSSF